MPPVRLVQSESSYLSMQTEPALTILSWALVPLHPSFGAVTAALARSGSLTWPLTMFLERTVFFGRWKAA